eukprot:NODE_78_length_23131_cov_0.599427.p2 type:complete len:750 gc:universal NODE_78_length_23131_cov_0.599427:22682-20433(-)
MSGLSTQNYDHRMAALLPPARVLGTYYQGGSVFAVSYKFKEKDVTLIDTKSNAVLELDKQGVGVLEPGAEYIVYAKNDSARRKSKTIEIKTVSKPKKKNFGTASRSNSGIQVEPVPVPSERRKSILEFSSLFSEQVEIEDPPSPIDAEEIIKRLKVPPFKGYLEVQISKESPFLRRIVELVAFNIIVTTGNSELDKIVYTLNKNAMALVSEKSAMDYNFDLFAGNDIVTFKCISKAQMMAWVSSINSSCMNLLLLEIMPTFDLRVLKLTLDKSFKFYSQKVNTNIEDELDQIIKNLSKYSSFKKVAIGNTVAAAPRADTQLAVNFFTVLTAKRSISRKVTAKKSLRTVNSQTKSTEFLEIDEDLINRLQDLLKSDKELSPSKDKIIVSEQHREINESNFSITSFNGEGEEFLEELYRVIEMADVLPEPKKAEIKKQAKDMSSFISRNTSGIFSNERSISPSESNTEISMLKIADEISRIPDLRAPVKNDESNLGMLRQDSWDDLGNPQVYYSKGTDSQTSKFDIAAASIDKLIERLADRFGPADESFLKTIFMCYRYVIDSQSLLKKIIQRMNSEVDDKDEKFTRLHLHTRMIKAVSFWLEHYWIDFQSPEMQLTLQGFLAIVEDNVSLNNNMKFKTLLDSFGCLIQAKIEETTHQLKRERHKKAPKVLIDKFLLAYNSQTISKSLTELEFERLQKLRPLEMLLQLWSPEEDNSEICENLLASINSFNNVVYTYIDHKLGVFRNIVGNI